MNANIANIADYINEKYEVLPRDATIRLKDKTTGQNHVLWPCAKKVQIGDASASVSMREACVALMGEEWTAKADLIQNWGTADERTRAYLLAIQGDVKVGGGSKTAIVDRISIIRALGHTIERGVDAGGNNVVEVWDAGPGGDDPACIRYTSKSPIGHAKFAALERAQYLRAGFLTGKLQPTFRCWECGRETHWLDVEGVEGSLEAKTVALEECYCGC